MLLRPSMRSPCPRRNQRRGSAKAGRLMVVSAHTAAISRSVNCRGTAVSEPMAATGPSSPSPTDVMIRLLTKVRRYASWGMRGSVKTSSITAVWALSMDQRKYRRSWQSADLSIGARSRPPGRNGKDRLPAAQNRTRTAPRDKTAWRPGLIRSPRLWSRQKTPAAYLPAGPDVFCARLLEIVEQLHKATFGLYTQGNPEILAPGSPFLS